MNTNILISSDEEKYINDILDKGISDIISTNPNPNLLKSSLINVEHSYLNTEKKPKPATGSLLEDTSNSNVLIKSNALRQLLDEMKSNNNYITSSEDEMEKRIRFGNLKLKKYSELDKIKEQEGIDRSLDENPLRNQMNTNMKIEITSLKDKIESLQDKLIKNSKSSYGESRLRKSKAHKERKNVSDDEIITNKKFKGIKGLAGNFIHNYKTSGESFLKRTKQVLDKSIRTRSKARTSASKDNIDSTSYSISNTPKYAISNLKLKDKYDRLKETNEVAKANLIKERKKVIDLTKENKRIKRKEIQFDELLMNNKELIKKCNQVVDQLEESELIRKEQAKLIKSLQREIDMLRGRFNEDLRLNTDNVEISVECNETIKPKRIKRSKSKTKQLNNNSSLRKTKKFAKE